MEPWAFAIPSTISSVSVTTFDVFYSGAVSDGVSLTEDFSLDYIWDTTQSVATNIANAKTAIVNFCASVQGIQLLTSQVSIFTAVD